MSEDTAPFARQTFGEYAAERSIQARADGLNAKGQRTPRSVKALNKIPKNHVYIGEHHYGDIAVGVWHTCAGQQGHVRQMDLNTSTLSKGTLLFSTVLRQPESMDHACRGSLRDVTTQGESRHLFCRTTFL
nr:recombinase family protein [Bifidobacterium indicum]